MDIPLSVGRVGGLAVALGIGVAISSGIAVADADTNDSGTASTSPASAPSPGTAGPPAHARKAPRQRPQSASTNREQPTSATSATPRRATRLKIQVSGSQAADAVDTHSDSALVRNRFAASVTSPASSPYSRAQNQLNAIDEIDRTSTKANAPQKFGQNAARHAALTSTKAPAGDSSIVADPAQSVPMTANLASPTARTIQLASPTSAAPATAQASTTSWFTRLIQNLLLSIFGPKVTTPPATSPPIFVGDYSTGDFTQWKFIQNKFVNSYPTDYSPTYPATIVNDPTKGKVARYEVRHGDVPDFGGGERSEVGAGTETGGREGDTRFYSFSTKFDSTFQQQWSSSTWGVTNQWHTEEDLGLPPPVAFTYDGWSGNIGRWQLTVNAASKVIWSTPLDPGQWHDIVIEIGWSHDPKLGYIRLWQNGVAQSLADGSTTWYGQTMTAGSNNTYYKEGLYRSNDTTSTGIVYHTGFKAATTKENLSI